MFLDADDLIHRDLLAYVLGHGRESYLIDDGSFYDASSGLLWRRRAGFHRICGSSLLCAFHPEELPTSWEDESCPFASFGSNPYQRGHQEYDLVAAELGRHRLVFPSRRSSTSPTTQRAARGCGRGAERLPTGMRELIWPRDARAILHDDFGASDLGTASVRRTAVSLYRTAARRAVRGAARLTPLFGANRP
jgi:hypothetical protein